MRLFSRIGAVLLILGLASIVQAQGPMEAYVRYQDAQSRGLEAHANLTAVQNTYAAKLDQYYDDLAGYNNPNWTQTVRLGYQNADNQAAQIIYVLTERGFWAANAIDKADGWLVSGHDYMTYSQWADAIHSFDVAIGNAAGDIDYDYTAYMIDFDLYVDLCGWIGYMDALQP